MSASFADSFDQLGGDSPVAAASAQPFDEGYLGYDPHLPTQRFDSFSNFVDSDSVKGSVAGDSPISTSQPIPDPPSPLPPIYASAGGFGSNPVEFSSFTPEENGVPLNGSYVASDGPVLPPPMKMQPEEGFALREWRRQNAIRLEEKEKREKELLSEIIDEADAYKVEFHRKRQVSCETYKGTNREKEKLFLSSREKFHAEADKHYWKAISELIPNEVPTIEKRGKKKDDEKKPSIVVVQGPKPGKPTDLSRMRHIILKLKHDTPAHLKSSPSPASASTNTKDAKTGDSISPKVAAMTTPSEAVAVA